MMKLDESKIYKVTHTILYRGQNEGIFKTDLQFDEGLWYLVFEWTTNHDGEFPSVRHPVDPKDLKPFGDELLLEFPVEIPDHPFVTEAIAVAKDRK